MKFTKIALSTIGALALLASTSALAGTLTVNGSGWFVPEAVAANVPLNTSGLGPAQFTFNAPGLNFSAATPNYSVLDFLNSGSATNIVDNFGPPLTNPMDDGTTGTIFEFTGTAYFVNGQRPTPSITTMAL